MQVNENGIDLLGSDLMDKLNVMEVVPKIGTAQCSTLELELELELGCYSYRCKFHKIHVNR